MAGVIEDPIAEQHQVHDLNPSLGVVHLIALGIGAIIGAGIFVITGHAAASYAGPAVVISFAIAGAGCLFAGLCYAEYAAMIPVAGSAYTYTYATLGRFMAWFIGWNLVLEYLAAGSTVAVGWSGYFTDFMAKQMHVAIPLAFSAAPFAVRGVHDFVLTGAFFNLPAIALIAMVTTLLIVGVHLSANFNNCMVAIKLCIVVLVIAVGLPYVVHANQTPFIPPNTGTFGHFGWTGVFRATGVIFFAYIGFDAVSVAAQEARNPKRDVPIGILGSLLICTVLYMLMSYVLTGLAPYTTLNVTHPVSMAVETIPATAWLGPIVNAGAIVGLASVVLVLLLGQSRIFYAMSRDGMIPPLFSQIHPKFKTPWRGSHHHRHLLRVAGRTAATGYSGRTGFHRHAAGVRDRLLRRHGAAHSQAQRKATVPHPFRVDRRPARHRDVRLHDGLSAVRHLAAASGVDDYRHADLYRLQRSSRQAATLAHRGTSCRVIGFGRERKG